MRYRVLTGFFTLLAAFAQQAAADDASVELFTEVYPSLEEAMKMLEEQRRLPESSYFSTDKGDKEEDINELLDEAVEKLEFPDIARFRREISIYLERGYFSVRLFRSGLLLRSQYTETPPVKN